ncbi:MAG: class I SAM-dependent methyltransferase family protein [Promethearchaeota archaeon]
MSKKKYLDRTIINFLKVERTEGQFIIRLLKNHFVNDSIIDQRYHVSHEDRFILFPLVDNQEAIDRLKESLDRAVKYAIISREGSFRENYKYKSLEEALTGKIPNSYFNLIPKSYDITGNIAILEFDKNFGIRNSEFRKYKQLISNAVMSVNKNVKSVFEKKSKIKGDHRLREFCHLSGENKSITMHKENNCVFKLDIKKTYFSPRLVYERRRISNFKFQENEIIVDMFAGVGPFSIQIAKLNPVEIHAFDINPEAYKYLKINIKLNKLKGKIIPYNIDVRSLPDPSNTIGKRLYGTVDRIIMNLPQKSIDFIDLTCFLMKKSGGILHFYQFSEKPNPIENIIEVLNNKLNCINWNITKVESSKIVKSYSPKAELVAIDLNIKSII